MIETSLMVNDYPEPPEEKEKTISGKIILTFDFEADVPEKWNYEKIIEDIKQNLSDYISAYDYEEIEIEF